MVNSALALCPPPGSHSQRGQGQGKKSANPGLSCPGLWVLRQPTRNVQLPLTSYPRPGCLGFGLLSIWGVTYDSAKIWEPTEKGPVLQAINGDMSNLGNRAARTGPTEVCHSALLSKLGLPPVPPHSSTYPSTLPSISPPIHPCTSSSFHLSTHPSIHPSIHPSSHPTTHHPTIHLSIHPSIHPTIYPPTHPPIYPSISKYLAAIYPVPGPVPGAVGTQQ